MHIPSQPPYFSHLSSSSFFEALSFLSIYIFSLLFYFQPNIFPLCDLLYLFSFFVLTRLYFPSTFHILPFLSSFMHNPFASFFFCLLPHPFLSSVLPYPSPSLPVPPRHVLIPSRMSMQNYWQGWRTARQQWHNKYWPSLSPFLPLVPPAFPSFPTLCSPILALLFLSSLFFDFHSLPLFFTSPVIPSFSNFLHVFFYVWTITCAVTYLLSSLS